MKGSTSSEGVYIQRTSRVVVVVVVVEYRKNVERIAGDEITARRFVTGVRLDKSALVIGETSFQVLRFFEYVCFVFSRRRMESETSESRGLCNVWQIARINKLDLN